MRYRKEEILDAGAIAVDCETTLHLDLKDSPKGIRITLRAPKDKIPTYEIAYEKKVTCKT